MLPSCRIVQSPQVWSDLRSKGIKTPEIAIWQRVPTPTNPFNAANRGRAIYPYALNVYNDPRFQQVCVDTVAIRCAILYEHCVSRSGNLRVVQLSVVSIAAADGVLIWC